MPVAEPTAVESEADELGARVARALSTTVWRDHVLIAGRVVDAQGVPVPNPNVVVFLGSTTEPLWADDDGVFQREFGACSGVGRCLAWKDGSGIAIGEWFALRAGDRIDAGTLRCGQVAPIAGWVVDPDGQRWAGNVSVEWTDAFDPETWELVRRCTGLDCVSASDREGLGLPAFAIRSLPPGRYRLRAADGAETRTVTAPASDVVLAAPRPDAVTWEAELSVTDWDGSTVTEFTATAEPSESTQRVTWAPADRDGHRVLRIWSDRGGYVNVYVELPDGRCASGHTEPRDLRLVELRLSRPDDAPDAADPSATIRGTVVSDRGPVTWRPRNGRNTWVETRVMLVAIREGEREPCAVADTAKDGSFEIDGLREGSYRVWAWPGWSSWELASSSVVARAGDSGVEIGLPAARSRRFRLVLPAGYDRIDDYDCSVGGPEGEHDSADCAPSRGGLLVTGLREDVPYSLSARVRCGTAWTATTSVPTFIAGDGVPEIRLSPGLRIEGIVVRPDGSPVVGAVVRAEEPQDVRAETTTSLDGGFALTGLDPGRWTLSASAPGLAKGQAITAAGTTGSRIVMQSER